MKTKMILAALVTMFGFAANAGIHVEPYIGYSLSGDWEQGSSNGDYTSDGPQLGARLGYGMLGFFGAIDYELSSMEGTDFGNSDVSVDQSLLGISVGYEFPILIRGYFTYILDATGELDDSGNTELTGTGTKLGVGYTGLPFIAINFELTMLNFDEADGNAITDFEATYYTVNISAPFDF